MLCSLSMGIQCELILTYLPFKSIFKNLCLCNLEQLHNKLCLIQSLNKRRNTDYISSQHTRTHTHRHTHTKYLFEHEISTSKCEENMKSIFKISNNILELREKEKEHAHSLRDSETLICNSWGYNISTKIMLRLLSIKYN